MRRRGQRELASIGPVHEVPEYLDLLIFQIYSAAFGFSEFAVEAAVEESRVEADDTFVDLEFFFDQERVLASFSVLGFDLGTDIDADYVFIKCFPMFASVMGATCVLCCALTMADTGLDLMAAPC